MNELSNYFGLVGCALLCGAVVGLFFPARKVRLAVAALVALLSLTPWSAVPSSSLASRVFAFYDVPSVSTLVVAALALWKPAIKFRVGAFWRIAPILVGLLLYLSEFNVLSVDLYRFGYFPVFALVAAGVAVLFGDPIVVVVMCVANVLHAAGVYANFFDACFDFPFWIGSIVFGVMRLGTRLAPKKSSATAE